MRYMSREEKISTFGEITRRIKEYPVIPTYKADDDLIFALEHGFIDFIADTEYWQITRPEYKGIVRKIAPWGIAEVGFHIRARTIEDIVRTVHAIIRDHREVTFIYFKVHSPEIPFPRICMVERELETRHLLEMELKRPDEWIRDDLYDY